MKLIQKHNITRGECLPDSWVSFGKTDSYINGVNKYLVFRLPLFILKFGYDISWDLLRFGWYTPSIYIRYGSNCIDIRCYTKFHSDFMNEPLYKDPISNEEYKYPYDMYSRR